MREIYLFSLAERSVDVILQLFGQRYIIAESEPFGELCEILDRWFFPQLLP
jgi:hypothetical protein